ncbi:MAG: hypothetical protein Q9227_003985 [Pyrenula ochraceoflavens]
MDSTHWTARAFLTSSMVLGILSVVFATNQQQNIGMLNNPLAIRMWLSRGPPRTRYHSIFDDLPLESSVSAIKITQIPTALLQLAVLVFFVGFGLYLIFSWTENVEAGGSDYRNIFILFVITIAVVLAYYAITSIFRLLDQQTVSSKFDTKRVGLGEGKPLRLRVLEYRLRKLQEEMSYDSQIETRILELEARLRELEAQPVASEGVGNIRKQLRHLQKQLYESLAESQTADDSVKGDLQEIMGRLKALMQKHSTSKRVMTEFMQRHPDVGALETVQSSEESLSEHIRQKKEQMPNESIETV